ncbi:Immunoglobulin C1-set domain [Mactra antiquata]
MNRTELTNHMCYTNCLTTTLTPVDPEIVEGNDVTFVCTVSAAVNFVTWKLDVNETTSFTVPMGVRNGACTLSPQNAYLSDTTKYWYNCSNTVYQVTVKNVQKDEHNYRWSCLPKDHSSGPNSTIKVKVPVSSVSITPTSPKDVIENTAIEFTCQTSPARPNAKVTWYKEESGIPSLINQTITSNTADDDFSVTTSTLKFVPSRQQNGIKIFCKAENAANKSPKESNKKTLNVLYKATYPVITQGKKFLVIEGHSGILSCYTSGGNPTPTLSWSCNNLSPTKSNTSNIGNITKTITWTAVRGSDTKCSCTFEQTGFPNIDVNVIVTVLYPPSPPKFQVNGKTINDDIKFIVNKARTIQCVTDSNPPPHSYKWYGPKTNDEQNLTFNSVQKTHAGNYTCKVKNTMNPSSDGIISGSNSSSVKLVVLYPPSMLQLYNGSLSGTLISERSINVIKGDTLTIGCKSKNGEPEPSVRWQEQNGDDPLLTIQVLGSLTSKTCTATNTMRETGGNADNGSISDTIQFNVLVPPTVSGCTFYYNNIPTNKINITAALMIQEHETFTLNCSSAGNPSPSVSWTLPSSSTETTKSTQLTIKNVRRNKKGNYVFLASSTLRPSYQDIRDFNVNKSITVEILFPPTVQNMATISKLEGSPLAFSCTYTVGFPTDTTVKWTRDVDGRTWNQQLLSISNITKEDTGHYQCNVSNTMQPTGDSQSFTGSDVKAFYLNVLYKASITKFVIDGLTENAVTVNERDPVPFVCDVDSNPLALVTLKNTNGLLKSVTADTLNYNNEAATCIDADTYSCSARNDYNGGIESIKTIKLFVNCRPRSAAVVDQNRTCERKAQYKFTFNAIAYPVPNFTWWKLVDDTWTQLESNDDYLIQSSDLQTNFTIHSVQPRDFTNYKLVANNTIDIFEQIYTLSENDKPDDIKQFKHLDDLTTTTSIGLTWKPGSNGGLPQTFHIRYKKSSTTTWNYVNINDTGDHVMNYTITGLTDKTQYDVVIYASNRKGNSKESALIALTKEREETSSYIFGIAGGVGGAVAVGAGVFVVILNVRRNRLLKRKKENETELNRRSVAEDSDEEDDKTTKKNGKTSKDNATGDLYENVGHMINDRNDSKLYVNLNELSRPKVPKKNVNKDGLIYADVVFQDQPNGRKNIIIGDESTPYSQIDFTKKADPLPDLDDKNA